MPFVFGFRLLYPSFFKRKPRNGANFTREFVGYPDLLQFAEGE